MNREQVLERIAKHTQYRRFFFLDNRSYKKDNRSYKNLSSFEHVNNNAIKWQKDPIELARLNRLLLKEWNTIKGIKQTKDQGATGFKEWIASNPEDFQKILDREFAREQPKDKKTFIKKLQSLIIKMKNELELDYSALEHYYHDLENDKELYQNFLNWLDDKTNFRKITAPTIVAAIKLLLSAGVEEVTDSSNKAFCQRICEKYRLHYSDKVRQGFSGAPTKAQYKSAMKLIVPTFPLDVRDKISRVEIYK